MPQSTLAGIAVAEPLNCMVDLAGPDVIPLDEVVRQFLKANCDPRTVIPGEQAAYFGIPSKHAASSRTEIRVSTPRISKRGCGGKRRSGAEDK